MRSILSTICAVTAVAASLLVIPTATANATPREMGVSSATVQAAQAQASRAARAVAVARQQVGKPYVYGAAGPQSFDCSGLTQYAYAKAGLRLPHNALQQYQSIAHVALASLRLGDLVFMNFSGGSPAGITHVGIYAGGGNWYVAKQPGTRIALQHIWTHQGVYAGRP